MAYKDVLYGDGDADLSYAKLVSLHKKVMSIEWEVIRAKSLYERLLRQAFRLEDILKARGNPEQFFLSLIFSCQGKSTGLSSLVAPAVLVIK